MISKKIEAVIFDLGRVLIHIDLQPLQEKLSEAVRSRGGDLIEQVRSSGLITQLNTGRISPAEFHRRLCVRFGIDWPLERFQEAWCSIFSPNQEMEDLVRRLRGRVPLGLLSDTDPIHWDYIRCHFPIVKAFERPVLSFEVGAVKPDPAMYRAAAESVGTSPESCFYTDDLVQNVEGARAAGMISVLFENADQIDLELEKFGVLKETKF